MDDGLKLIKKELIIPIKSNGNVFLLVPILFFDFSLILAVAAIKSTSLR